MKALLISVSLMLLFVTACVPNACTKETQVCKDGTIVSRDPTKWCEFEPCPQPKECGIKAKCEEGWDCYAFTSGNYCYFGDPCIAECGRYDCEVLKTYPIRIRCIK